MEALPSKVSDLQNLAASAEPSTATDLSPGAPQDAQVEVCKAEPEWSPSFALPETPRWLLSACSFGCLATGLATIFIAKWQNRHFQPPCLNCAPVFYEQPYWQTWIMFAAESLCLPIHGVDMMRKRRQDRKVGKLEFPAHSWSLDRPPVPWWWFALPAAADLVGTSLVNVAFTMTYASTVQMLRNSLVLITATISMFTMKRALRVYEWVGIAVMTLGMFMSGMDSIMRPETSTNVDPSMAYLGVLLTLLGTILNAITIISEEWMLKARYCPPFRAVGYCGLNGLIMNTLALPVIHVSRVSDVRANFYMIANSQTLIASQFLYIGASLTFNGTGMIVTKVGTGLLKGMLYACRAPLMWLIEMCLGWQSFGLLSLGGLILTFGGFFIFANALPRSSRCTRLNRAYDHEVACPCTVPQTDQQP